MDDSPTSEVLRLLKSIDKKLTSISKLADFAYGLLLLFLIGLGVVICLLMAGVE